MANGAFNRGSNNAGRKRDGSRLPGQSASEGNVGNVIPRPTTIASIRRAQSLLRILNDKQPGGNQFSRGTTKGGVRRNFAMMAQMSTAAATTGVQLVRGSTPSSVPVVDWDSENYDYEGWWTSGTNLTCPATGTYQITYSLAVVYGAGGITMRIFVNGASVDSETFTPGTSPISKSASVPLVIGDVINLNFTNIPGQEIRAGTLTIS